MDTKLKNSKFNPIIKAIILILTLVFAFLAGTNALDLARRIIYFNYETADLRNTIAFTWNLDYQLDELSTLYFNLDSYSQNMSFEEFRQKSVEAQNIKSEYAEKLNKALNIFNTITEFKKLEPALDNTKYVNDEYNEDIFYDQHGNIYYSFYEFKDYLDEYYYQATPTNTQTTTATVIETSGLKNVTAPAVMEEATTFSFTIDSETINELPSTYRCHAEWEYYYQALRREIFAIVDDARSIETIKAEINQDLESVLFSTYEQKELEYQYYYENLSSGINFYIQNIETGNYVSSFETETEIETFKTNFKNDYYYFYSDGKNLEATPISMKLPDTVLFNLLNDLFLLNPLSNFYNGDAIFCGKNCIVYFSLEKPTSDVEGFYSLFNTFEKVSDININALKIQTSVFSLLSILGIIALSILSSKPKDGTVRLNLSDRAFFILQLAFYLFITVLGIAGIIGFVMCDFGPEMTYTNDLIKLLVNNNLTVTIIGILVTLITLAAVNFILYIVKNIKAHSFKERFICYKIFKSLKKIKNSIKTIINKNKELRKTVKQIEKQLLLIIVGWTFCELLIFILTLALWFNGLEPGAIFFAILFIVLLSLGFIFILKFLGQTKTLAIAVENMKNGNLDINLDSTKFVFPLKDFAKNLDDCRDSIENAVSEALKGERLKTELITNVSHDLKTPLTSIINYVSLLKLCDIKGEDENKYLDILDEKSKKLQRLIEDLTEASKASSGNIKMTVDTVNLNELALQAVGENNDVLENVGLDVIVSQKDSDLYVKADSQHTFRIFDNLFSNVKKYALSGTRVYVDVYKDGNYGVFSVKNISKDKLNITADEITERFVRGDNSRTTEGSGLGLSIARSFTELQNGIFSIEIDGDLFKVTVKLPVTNKPEIKKTPSPSSEFGTAKVNEIS